MAVEAVGSGDDARKIVRVEAWELTSWAVCGDDEPRVRDLDAAERLQFKRPRKIRDLIARLVKAGKLPDVYVRPTVGRTSMPNGGTRDVAADEYWLTEAQLLKVIRHCDTPVADAIFDEMVRVYMLARRGLLPAQAFDAPTAVRRLEAVTKRLVRERDDAVRTAAQAQELLVEETRRRLDVEAQLRSGGVLGRYRAKLTCVRIQEVASLNAPERASKAWQRERRRVETQVRRRIEYRGAWRLMPVGLERALTMAIDEEERLARERAAQTKVWRQTTIFEVINGRAS